MSLVSSSKPTPNHPLNGDSLKSRKSKPSRSKDHDGVVFNIHPGSPSGSSTGSQSTRNSTRSSPDESYAVRIVHSGDESGFTTSSVRSLSPTMTGSRPSRSTRSAAVTANTAIAHVSSSTEEELEPPVSMNELPQSVARTRKRRRSVVTQGESSGTQSPYKSVYADSMSPDSASDIVSTTSHTAHNCQSCSIGTRYAARLTINLHHHVNPFYSSLATYAMVHGNNWTFLNSRHEEMGKSDEPESTAVVPNSAQPVSLKPTTAAIPEEAVYLCQPCAMRFKRFRMKCDNCFHVPKLEERYVQYCSRCYDGVITRH